MSNTYYNILWADAQQQFRSLVEEEQRFLPGVELPEETSTTDVLIDLFVKYIQVLKKMDIVYDQIVHPQKRPLIRKLLDLVIVRALELREFIVDSELSEFFYMDHCLFNKYLPSDLEIPVPRYYYFERGPDFALREQWLESEHQKKLADEDRLSHVLRLDEDEDQYLLAVDRTDLMEELSLSFERAIRLLQTAERARQGRARYDMAKFIYEEEEKQRGRKKRQKQQFMDPNDAAVIIQRLVRRFIAYRKVQRRRTEELEFLGLAWSSKNVETPIIGPAMVQAKTWRNKIHNHEAERRIVQRRNQQAYIEAQQIIENRLRTLYAPEMVENMKLQIRNWFLEFKESRGKLPDFPKSLQGGLTAYLYSPEKFPDTLNFADDYEDDEEETDLSPKSKSPAVEDKSKKSKGKSSSKGKKSKETSKKEDKSGGLTASRSGPVEQPKLWQHFIEANEEYNAVWRARDETENPQQTHEEGIILAEKEAQLEKEVRAQVDVMMKNELAMLKDALSRRRGKKSKKTKKSGKGGKGGRKGKKKKKKGKDLTPDRTLESLYCELVYHGVIKKYPKIHLEDLKGECSLVNGTIRRYHEIMTEMQETFGGDRKNFPATRHPNPSFGDVKRVMKEICVLPLGSQTVHQGAPPVNKSLLITGPVGSGKKSLVHAVCTELGATLFDLTPSNLAGKYPGKPGLTMLVHLINKVGRLAQPTVLLIDEVEKMYQKRIVKTDKSEPKRLKKHLVKFLKSLGPDDQIMIIGLSSEPWSAPIKMIKKDYQKILYIPKADHGDRMAIWKNLLAEHGRELHIDVNCSMLAKLSDGWTTGAIIQVIKNVVKRHYTSTDEERRKWERSLRQAASNEASGRGGAALIAKPMRLGRKLIRVEDFLKELSQFDPLFFEQEKLWNSWFSKTPPQRDRIAAAELRMNEIKALAAAEDEEEGEGENGAKKKKPKKKSKGKKKKSIS